MHKTTIIIKILTNNLYRWVNMDKEELMGYIIKIKWKIIVMLHHNNSHSKEFSAEREEYRERIKMDCLLRILKIFKIIIINNFTEKLQNKLDFKNYKIISIIRKLLVTGKNYWKIMCLRSQIWKCMKNNYRHQGRLGYKQKIKRLVFK